MKWILRTIAWIMLIGVVLLAPSLVNEMPKSSEGLATKVYDSWAGVLRIWVYIGWQPGSGSLSPWLNTAVTQFEKRNPGVFVQITSVTAAQLASFASGPERPPDAIIFSPGVLDSGEGLISIEMPDNLLAPLSGLGDRAVPIAMGGYAWAVNTRLIQTLPLWDVELPAPKAKADPAFVMTAPRDGEYLSWSGALMALCMAPAEQDGAEQEPIKAGEGLDIGLIHEEQEETDIIEETPGEELYFTMPERLPEGFRADNSVTGDFAAQRAAGIPVTQYEIKKLENLADTGRAPDYQIMNGARAYTDQLALLGIVDSDFEQAQEKQELLKQLAAFLLDDKRQAALANARALRVTKGAALYTGGQGMGVLERAYGGDFLTPDVFDASYVDKNAANFDSTLSKR